MTTQKHHEAAHHLLHRYWFDADSLSEVRSTLEHAVAHSPDAIVQGLHSLEHLINTSNGDGSLLHLVASSANQSLSDASEEAAKRWLMEAAALVRETLGSSAP